MQISTNQPSNKILLEQVSVLYRTLPVILTVNLVVSAALAYGLWHVTTQVILSWWLAALLVSIAMRSIGYFLYLKNFSATTVKSYANYFVIGSSISALLWGLLSIAVFPSELEQQLFMLFVLASLGAGSVASLTIYLPAFYAYFPISMLPMGLLLISESSVTQVSLGVMTITYVTALSYFGFNIHQSQVRSMKLGFENLDLVKQLRIQKDEAERANISKSKFLAAASHDLRQPLHALSLFTSVLEESTKDQKQQKLIKQITASIDSLQSLFNALLDISRFDAGVMKAERVSFPLQNLFDTLANDFNAQAEQKNLKIHWQATSSYVYTDPNLLEQILRNYLSNAIRYTDKGSIHIDCKELAGQITISVTDTGTGIPKDEQKAIFEEFHQLNNPERDRSKGLGLGLAIVKHTAKLLDLPIDVKSNPNSGASFLVSVPKSNKTISKIVTDTIHNEASQSLTDILVLIIDDETSILEGTCSLLESWGCRVLTAKDLHAALTLLKQAGRSPDAIIADYRLRENQTGVDAIETIKKTLATNIPALIVTGDIASERLRDVNKSGYQVLHKPVPGIKLRTFLRHVKKLKSQD